VFRYRSTQATLSFTTVPYKRTIYVTDNTDDDASTDWVDNVAKGTVLFADVLAQEYGKSSLL